MDPPKDSPPPAKQDQESTLRAEVEKLGRELAAAQHERSQSAAYGLELLNEKENLQQKYDSIEAMYEQSKRELQELREAWNKAVAENRISASSVFEKEVQLLNDSDAQAASFTLAIHEVEKELKHTKSLLASALVDRDRFLTERDELSKRVTSLEQERKNLKSELKELKSRESKLFNENGELEEENVSLQKQVSNLRSTQVEFESSKHEIQRLQDDVATLNAQLEEVVGLKRITERQMQEALEALQSEREQKYALRKELDKRTSADPLNWTSLAGLRGSPHLANLALRGFGSSHRSSIATRENEDGSSNGFSESDVGPSGLGESEQSYDIIHDLEMPSIEGSLFDEVHLSEIKKLQQNLEEKENQRNMLNAKLTEVQHKLESKGRQAEEIEKKLVTICSLVEYIYNETETTKPGSKRKDDLSREQQTVTTKTDTSTGDEIRSEVVSSTTGSQQQEASPTSSSADTKTKKLNVLEDFESIYSHLQNLYSVFKAYQEMSALAAAEAKELVASKEAGQLGSDLLTSLTINELGSMSKDKKNESIETLQTDDVQTLRNMLYKKNEKLKQMRTILKSNKDTADVALRNLKSKYDMEKAVVVETMTKLRLDHKRLCEDAATFASLRSHFSARIVEYNSEIEKLQSKLNASEQEKNTLNTLLRMSIEQKVMLTQKLEALEVDREDSQAIGSRGSNGQASRLGASRARGSANRNMRQQRGGNSRLSGTPNDGRR